MKILHCADIHLDSAMTANLDKDKARERRNELLASFKDMVGYAVKERIGVIIIAGDLFDTRNISVGAKKEVYNIIIQVLHFIICRVIMTMEALYHIWMRFLLIFVCLEKSGQVTMLV